MNQVIFFRRCHVCGSTTQSQTDKVDVCKPCGKHFAPFFYFDERFIPVASEATVRPLNISHDKYNPIQGLTAYWNKM